MRPLWRVLYDVSDQTEETLAPGASGRVAGGCATLGITATVAAFYYLLETIAPSSPLYGWMDEHLVAILLVLCGAYAIYAVFLGFWLAMKGTAVEASPTIEDENSP